MLFCYRFEEDSCVGDGFMYKFVIIAILNCFKYLEFDLACDMVTPTGKMENII